MAEYLKIIAGMSLHVFILKDVKIIRKNNRFYFSRNRKWNCRI